MTLRLSFYSSSDAEDITFYVFQDGGKWASCN